MDYKFWLALLVTVYGPWLTRKQVQLMNPKGASTNLSSSWAKRHWPMLLMLALILIIWAPFVYSYYYPDQVERLIPEFDAPDASVIRAYGQDTPNSCSATANGTALLSRQKSYKLAVACFVGDGSIDPLDVPHLQVSNLYDIHEGDITMRAFYKSDFDDYRKLMHSQGGIAVVLLNVPNGVEPSQFITLRQARALGVKIISIGIAKSELRQQTPLPGR